MYIQWALASHTHTYNSRTFFVQCMYGRQEPIVHIFPTIFFTMYYIYTYMYCMYIYIQYVGALASHTCIYNALYHCIYMYIQRALASHTCTYNSRLPSILFTMYCIYTYIYCIYMYVEYMGTLASHTCIYNVSYHCMYMYIHRALASHTRTHNSRLQYILFTMYCIYTYTYCIYMFVKYIGALASNICIYNASYHFTYMYIQRALASHTFTYNSRLPQFLHTILFLFFSSFLHTIFFFTYNSRLPQFLHTILFLFFSSFLHTTFFFTYNSRLPQFLHTILCLFFPSFLHTTFFFTYNSRLPQFFSTMYCIYTYIYCIYIYIPYMGALASHTCIYKVLSHCAYVYIYNGLPPPVHAHTTLAFHTFVSQYNVYTRIYIVCIFIYDTCGLSRPIHVYIKYRRTVHTCIYTMGSRLLYMYIQLSPSTHSFYNVLDIHTVRVRSFCEFSALFQSLLVQKRPTGFGLFSEFSIHKSTKALAVRYTARNLTVCCSVLQYVAV